MTEIPSSQPTGVSSVSGKILMITLLIVISTISALVFVLKEQPLETPTNSGSIEVQTMDEINFK